MDGLILRWDDIEQIEIVNRIVDEFVDEVVYDFSCCLSS